MLEEMTPEQFITWRAYAILEPFPDERADLHAALICKTLWDINRDTKKHPQPFPLDQFVLKYGGKFGLPKEGAAPQRTQTIAEKTENLKLWAMALAAPAKG